MTFVKYGFDEVLVDATRRCPKVQAAEYMVVGHFPVIDQGALDVAGYVDDELLVTRVERPRILFGDHTRRFKYASSDFVLGADGVKALEVLPGFDPRYVFHALRHTQLPNAGYSRHFKFLKAATLIAPDLGEQKRIAAILDQADELRAKRRRSIDMAERLSISLFMSMFGDVRDQSRGDLMDLGRAVVVGSGSTPRRNNPRNYGGDVPWVKTGEVVGESIWATSEHVTALGIKNARLKIYPPGTVIVAMYGQGATRGRSAILGIDAAVNQACAAIAPSPLFHPRFLAFQVGLLYPVLRRMGRGGSQENLNLPLVRQVRVACPDLARQSEFLRQLDLIQQGARKGHLAHLDELFASLQHRAFTGQL